MFPSAVPFTIAFNVPDPASYAKVLWAVVAWSPDVDIVLAIVAPAAVFAAPEKRLVTSPVSFGSVPVVPENAIVAGNPGRVISYREE